MNTRPRLKWYTSDRVTHETVKYFVVNHTHSKMTWYVQTLRVMEYRNDVTSVVRQNTSGSLTELLDLSY